MLLAVEDGADNHKQVEDKPHDVGNDDRHFPVDESVYDPDDVEEGIGTPRDHRDTGGILREKNIEYLRDGHDGTCDAGCQHGAIKQAFPEAFRRKRLKILIEAFPNVQMMQPAHVSSIARCYTHSYRR